MALKQLTLRRDDMCAHCSTPVAEGSTAWWDGPSRSVFCAACEPSQRLRPLPRSSAERADRAAGERRLARRLDMEVARRRRRAAQPSGAGRPREGPSRRHRTDRDLAHRRQALHRTRPTPQRGWVDLERRALVHRQPQPHETGRGDGLAGRGRASAARSRRSRRGARSSRVVSDHRAVGPLRAARSTSTVYWSPGPARSSGRSPPTTGSGCSTQRRSRC